MIFLALWLLFILAALALTVWWDRNEIDLLGDEDDAQLRLYGYADRDVRGLPR